MQLKMPRCCDSTPMLCLEKKDIVLKGAINFFGIPCRFLKFPAEGMEILAAALRAKNARLRQAFFGLMRFFLIFTIFSFIFHPCFAESKKLTAKLYGNYLKGLFYAAEGNYRQGLEELQKAKRLDPESTHIRLKIASLLIRLGEIDKAEKELRQAKEVDPDSFDVSFALIFLYSYAQKDKELEKEYEEFLRKAAQVKPQDIKVSEYLAQFYFYKNRPQEAMKVYEAILKINPDYVEGIFWLGYFYEEAGRHADAIKMWKRVLGIDPHHAPTLNSLGYIYVEDGINLDEAEGMIREALAKDPENGAYLDSMGWAYFKKGNFKEAETYLKKAIGFVKDPVIYEHLGDLYSKLENLKEAVYYYQEGLKYFPDNKNLKEKLNKYGRKDKNFKK